MILQDFSEQVNRICLNISWLHLMIQTSTQIAVVIVKDLKGYSKADYAQRLGDKWGIGKKTLNNGVLILVKPRTSASQGEVEIVTGYGLGGAIPDITAPR